MSRTKKPRDPETLLVELSLLTLAERVYVSKELKKDIDNEVQQKQEAAKEAEQIANGK